MKTLTIENPGKVTIRETDMPWTGAGEVLFKMRCGGACGSDLKSYRGASVYVSYSGIPGYELFAGFRNALKKDFLDLIDQVKNNRILLIDINTSTYSFADGVQAFADFDKDAASILKVVLEFN